VDVTSICGPRSPGVWIVLSLAACSGKNAAPKMVVEDARGAQPAGDAAPAPVPGGRGDVLIKVEWKNVPADMRAASGRTPCGTPRPPAVEPTTLWGLPDVLVAIDAPGATPRDARRVVLDRCLLAPRVVITDGRVVVASAAELPQKLSIARAGQLPLGGAFQLEKPRDIYLPAAGHEVEIALEPGTIARLVAGDEDAWIVASDSAFVAITEASGSVVLRDVPAGTHEIVAWLPPRSGQPSRAARGKVTVSAGALAEVALDISTP
jgi:hypothetical protein